MDFWFQKVWIKTTATKHSILKSGHSKNKTAYVRSYKRRLKTTSLINKYKAVTLYAPISQNGQTPPTNCLNVFDHYLGLALKGLKKIEEIQRYIISSINRCYSEKCSGNTYILVYFGFGQENIIIYSWNFKVYIESEQVDFDYRLFAKVNMMCFA